MATKRRLFKHLPSMLAALALGLGVFVSVDGFRSNKPVETTFATYTNGDAATYYNTIDSTKTGNALLTALRTLNLSKRQSTVGYSSMGTTPSGQFKYTDYDTNSVQYDSNGQPYGTKISSFYTYTSATSWNREHVWPNSHGGGSGGDAGSPYPDADIHMPRPTISSENSSRGNSFFVEGMNNSSSGWDPYTAGYSENSRGEAARITFYCMLVNSKLALAPSNTTPSGTDPITGISFGSGHTMGNLETLIKWNINYPVTQREKNRNEGAEYLQGNRNAFIDHPEYACKIWGTVNSKIQSMCNNASWNTSPSVSISKGSASLVVDDTTTIYATASDSSAITWTSSDTTVVTVSNSTSSSGSNITLTGVGPGTATVTARATINSTTYSATCSVTVTSSGGGQSGQTSSYSILSSDVPSSYQTTAAESTAASGIKFYTYNVMNQSSKVQFKKSGGYLYNSESLNLGTLTLNGISGSVTVYGGTSRNPSSNTITGNNGVYDLSGYNYFKIINSSSSVATCSSILVELASSSTTKTLSSISVSTAPNKTTYTAGEYFSPGGLIILRNYSDSTYDTYSYANHTDEFTFSPTLSTALTTSNTSVTITYGGKTCTQSITVNAAKTLSSISVSGQTTSFTVGDTFTFGGTVTATFSDSSTGDVTSSATFNGYNMNNSGSQTVTVSYTYGGVTKTTSYSITVNSSGGSQTQTVSQKIVSKAASTYYENGAIYPEGSTSSANAFCNAFSLSWLQNSGNDNIVYTYDEMRVYAKHSLSITPNSGYTITSIVITANSSSYANAVGGSALTNCTKTVSNSIVTLTPTNGNSAVGFTNSAQSRLNYIVVNYEAPVSTSISASVSKTYYVGERILKSDITVKDNNNASLTTFTFANNEYQFTYSDAASGGNLTSKTFNNAITYGNLSCSLTVSVQRKAYSAPESSTITYTGAQFSAAGISGSYAEGQEVVIDYIDFTVDGYIYQSKISLSSSKTSAPGKITNTSAYPSGITNITVSGASPDIQLSVNGSTWVDLSSATTSSVDYYYFKLFYKTTSQSNYVNISSFSVTLKGYETPENLANYIMYTDTTNQCISKLPVAMGYLQELSTRYKSVFETSDDYVITMGRTRLEAWAASQGKTINYETGELNTANKLLNFEAVKQNNTALVISILCVIGGAAIIGCFYVIKKRVDE